MPASQLRFWSPSPSFHCFGVGGTRLTLLHGITLSHAHMDAACVALHLVAKAKHNQYGRGALFYDWRSCCVFGGEIHYLVSEPSAIQYHLFIKSLFARRKWIQLERWGEREGEKNWERVKLWGRKQEGKLGLMILIMHCLEMNGRWVIFLFDGQIDWLACLEGGEGLELQRRCVVRSMCWFWCRCFRIARSYSRTQKTEGRERTINVHAVCVALVQTKKN